MREERFKELLESFIDGTIKEKEYKEFQAYLFGIIKNIGIKFEVEENTVYIQIYENLEIKILQKREHFLKLINSGENVKGYLVTVIKNLFKDEFARRKKDIFLKSVKIEDMTEEEEDENRVLDRIAKKNNDILALMELEDLILKFFPPEELKYLCYKLDSKKYKCLWGNKSQDAIYQDVRRNSEKVLEKLRNILKENSVSEELFEEFLYSRLSDLCESLRSDICGG